MSKNKILIIHPALGCGGAEKIIAFISNSLCGKNNVHLLLLKNEKIMLPLDNRIELHIEDNYNSQPIIGKNLFKSLKSFTNLIKVIKKEVGRFNPQLVICFDLRILLALSIAMGKENNKVLFSERADPFGNTKYWQLILKKIYKKIGYIVFQTNEARSFYGETVVDKSVIIHNPALLRNFEKTIEVPESKDSVIFSAGRFQYRKGFDLLIKAFAEFCKVHPHYILKLYGDGEEKASLMALVKKYKIEDKVQFLGFLPDVIRHNRDAELFVLSSRSEGIPNILIEAMMAGIPCVTTDCSPGGAKLLSENGKVCLLSENNNYKMLADKLIFAVENPEYMKQLSIAAIKSLQKYDGDKIAGEWENVVEKILEK